MRKIVRIVLYCAVLGAAFGWWLSRPIPVSEALFSDLTGDPVHGEDVFWATGCASCHSVPGASEEDVLILAGGYRIKSPFGTFIAPNISPSDQGIGGWSTYDLANAVMAGVSPQNTHYYPALPYTSYRLMEPQDVVDLKAFMDTLPASDIANQPHEISFPFTLRRGLGLWKLLNMNPNWVMEDPETEQVQRGRYLVEAQAHCGECHTPRDAIGGLDRSRWMQGAPNPSGKGIIPPITPDKLSWSAEDIAYYLQSGFTPDFDSAGGSMVEVIAGLAHLSNDDRTAIAAYLKTVPPSE